MSLDQILAVLDRLDAAFLSINSCLDDPIRVDVVQDVLTRFTGNALIERMVAECAERLDVDLCALTLAGTTSQHILAASRPVAGGSREDSYCQFVAATGQTLSVSDNTDRPAFLVAIPVHEGIGAYLGVPVVSQGQQLGSLCAIHGSPRAWSASDQRLLDAYSAEISVVLDEASL